MNALWVCVVITAPFLVASKAVDFIDPESFKDPGGWKLPRGEILLFAIIVCTLSLLALLDFYLHGLPQ